MASSDENNHDFFDVLYGQKKGNTTAEALRKALIDEANAIKQVEDSPPEKLTELELARLEVVKMELIKKGIFKANDANLDGSISFFSSIQQYCANHFWLILKVATLPVILLVTFFLYQVNQSDSNLPELERIVKSETKKIDDFANNNINNSSVGTIFISTNHPEVNINQLKTKLKNAGAQLVETRISDNKYSLEVIKQEKTDVEAVNSILKQAGIIVNGEPPYRIIVN